MFFLLTFRFPFLPLTTKYLCLMSGFLALHNLSVGQFEYLWWTGHKFRKWPTNQNKGLGSGPMKIVVYRAHGAYVSYIHLFIKSILVNCKKLVVRARVINDQGDTPSQWGGQCMRGSLGSDDHNLRHWGHRAVSGSSDVCHMSRIGRYFIFIRSCASCFIILLSKFRVVLASYSQVTSLVIRRQWCDKDGQ